MKIDVYTTFDFTKEPYLELESWSLGAMCLLIGSCNSELSSVNVSMWTWIGYSTPYAILTMQHHMQTIIKTKENQKKKQRCKCFIQYLKNK